MCETVDWERGSAWGSAKQVGSTLLHVREIVGGGGRFWLCAGITRALPICREGRIAGCISTVHHCKLFDGLSQHVTCHQAILTQSPLGWCLIHHFLSSSKVSSRAPKPMAVRTYFTGALLVPKVVLNHPTLSMKTVRPTPTPMLTNSHRFWPRP
jgi:hypothetical protein